MGFEDHFERFYSYFAQKPRISVKNKQKMLFHTKKRFHTIFALYNSLESFKLKHISISILKMIFNPDQIRNHWGPEIIEIIRLSRTKSELAELNPELAELKLDYLGLANIIQRTFEQSFQRTLTNMLLRIPTFYLVFCRF